MTKPVVVVGSINLDLVAGADHIPKPGETIIGSSFQTFHGGKGANQAVAAAKLGYPTYMVGNVGHDAFGQQLRQALAEVKVNTRAVATVNESSGVALITIAADAENNIVGFAATSDDVRITASDLFRVIERGRRRLPRFRHVRWTPTSA